MGGFGGGKSSGKGASGSGGLSGADFGLINSAFGLGSEEISNRYHQLGLGIPDPGTFGGNPAVAQAAGGSLTYGRPSTMENMDIGGLGQVAQAALGQLQTQNVNNPAISGTPANSIFNAQQAGQAGQAATTLANLGGNVNPTPPVSTGV